MHLEHDDRNAGNKCTAYFAAGGTVTCAGYGCDVTFQNCRFDNCTFEATYGAKVLLFKCTFTNCENALICAGTYTRVYFLHGEISAWAQGVYACNGAEIRVEDVTSEGAKFVAFEAEGKGTQLNVIRCRLREFQNGGAGSWISKAVWAHRCAQVRLKACHIVGAMIGIAAESRGTSVAGDDVALQCAMTGVYVKQGAAVLLNGDVVEQEDSV
jgi:hypothetical protein